jgi:hypothetical protein
MQPHQTPIPTFEVWCNDCRTSFAAGTKRCIHCGERLSRARRGRALRVPRIDQLVDLPEEIDDLVVEEDLPKKKSPISPLTLVWIAVLLGGYLFQHCAER